MQQRNYQLTERQKKIGKWVGVAVLISVGFGPAFCQREKQQKQPMIENIVIKK